MAYNVEQKLTDNIAAIRIALEFENGRNLNDDDIEVLKKYSGFGGIKVTLYPDDDLKAWKDMGATDTDLKLNLKIRELHELVREYFDEKEYHSIIASLKNSILTSFYTPEIIPASFFEVLGQINVFPRKIYEPSAGAGVFIRAADEFYEPKSITAVEKDELSGWVLKAIASTLSVPVDVQVTALEKTTNEDNGQYDLVISNMPFGDFPVFDPTITGAGLRDSIHNYFFAKALQKVANGGIIAFITTDGFLNSPGNREARKHLFSKADFITMAVMPDNLMKDTGNTEAPSHFIVVQRRDNKTELSNSETLLLETEEMQNRLGTYKINQFLIFSEEMGLNMGETSPGQNQYGQAQKQVWFNGDIENIGPLFKKSLLADIAGNLNLEAFANAIIADQKSEDAQQRLTYLKMPDAAPDGITVQLDMFGASAENINRALPYISHTDEAVVKKKTAAIIGSVRADDNPEHDIVVIMGARTIKKNFFVYKLYSNVQQITFAEKWMNADALAKVLQELAMQLPIFSHEYFFLGDLSLGHTLLSQRPVVIEREIPIYKPQMLVLHGGKVGAVKLKSAVDNTYYFTTLTTQYHYNFFHAYIHLRDEYLELSSQELWGNGATDLSRAALNKKYDDFVSEYGYLNLGKNQSLIANDEPYGFVLLASLERREGERFVKSDILVESLLPPVEVFHTDDPVEALARCLNDLGTVDLGYICVATGQTEAAVIHQLETHIYLNPRLKEWETADRYLSGNVVDKMRLAEQAMIKEPENLHIRNSLEAIGKVQPLRIPYDLLDFNLGERWVPLRFYKRFAEQLFQTPTDIYYLGSTDIFRVHPFTKNAKITQEYFVEPKDSDKIYGHQLLEYALMNTSPYITYEVKIGGVKIKRPDTEAIQVAHFKIERIRDEYVKWLKDLPAEDKHEIEELYNETFNCYRLRTYDGSHLRLPGLDLKRLDIKAVYSSQKDGAWRIIQNRGSLIDHEIGMGKTLTMIIAAMEMKRLGIVHKPMIIGLKANVNQIVETFRKAYPYAKILAPTEEDFSPKRRLRLFHEIKNNNWDCVIITHEQFSRIPQSEEIQRDILETELDNVERDLLTLKDLGTDISKSMLKGLQIRQNNLRSKLGSVVYRIEQKKDSGVYFQDMGIDHLFVDESHMFKNLTFSTRHNRVAGLGNPEGSQKALNLLFAIRSLQEKFNSDLCVTFLSGTPISNSLTELYLIFKYLRPRELQRQHIPNFDAWAAVFAKKVTDFEFSVTNEIIAKERFRTFIKVPELAIFYNDITDYRTAKHIQLDKPEIKEVLVNIKPSPEQEVFAKNLIAFAKSGNAKFIGRKELNVNERKSKMLIATDYAKKMAVDMRLISPEYSDHPNNKISHCARLLAENYHKSKSHLGTQIVFCDIGTPQNEVFNIYDALKEKLVRDHNIPVHEITYIHDWTNKTKPQLFDKMNKGVMRILEGSTSKAGTGSNYQQRVVAMHNIDIPWRPPDLAQRSGRGARQGNIIAKEFYNNEVINYIYATERSLDNYKFNLLKNKQAFISQMKNSELSVRTIDEGAFDENSGMNFAEYIAILSGDTSLLEKVKVEKQVSVLEAARNSHVKETITARNKVDTLLQKKQSCLKMLERIDLDIGHYKEQLKYEADGSKCNPLILKDCSSIDPEVQGQHVINLYMKWKDGIKADLADVIGSLYGFDLLIRKKCTPIEGPEGYEMVWNNSFYVESPHSGITFTYNNGLPNVDNPKLAARYFLNALDRVNGLPHHYEKEIEEIAINIPILEKLTSAPFLQESELNELKEKLRKLETDISTMIIASQKRGDSLLEEQLEEIGNVELTAPNVGSMVISVPNFSMGKDGTEDLPRPRKSIKM